MSPDGSVVYDKVRTFMKKVPSMINMYKSIITSLNETIRISGNHLIYTRKYEVDMFNPQYVLISKNSELILADFISKTFKIQNWTCDKVISFRFADKVSIGDEVLVQKYDGLVPAKVTKVFSSKMQGNKFFYLYFLFS